MHRHGGAPWTARAPAGAAPAEPNTAYTGTCNSGCYGPLTVSEQGGGLLMTAGPANL
ncbi:hypothetical protein ACIRVF_03735 [Kitasatospora sp. NPDC101157]|uniref:hypothetical protein n=1 Tax=Kitasatospora sp. NPDC101157 TaxID=3364098 RepID=UPI00382C2AB4